MESNNDYSSPNLKYFSNTYSTLNTIFVDSDTKITTLFEKYQKKKE